MFRLLAALALAFPACLSAGSPTSEAPSPAAFPTQTVEPGARLAVVELFTSEGCSSCPPADALLRDLASRPDVVALSFHVDYWDDLGWRDPYGSAAFTARQRSYARSLGDNRVYTPEMVVGGVAGFVGSRPGEARSQIAAALARTSTASVTLSARRGAGRTVEADYAATGAPDGSVVHVALVQREAASHVARGENRGRTLRHAHVVRAFETRADLEGRVAFPLPDGLDAADVLVVAYVQRGATGAIEAAATARVG